MPLFVATSRSTLVGRAMTSRAQVRRAVPMVVVAVTAASLLAGVAAVTSPQTYAPARLDLVSHRVKTLGRVTAPPPQQAEQTLPTGGSSRPSGGSATIPASAFVGQTTKNATVRAGSLPITLGNGSDLGDVQIAVADQGTAQRLGVQGAVFSVDGSARRHAAAPLPVAVDYTSFARAGGADYAQRLTLVQLPGCSLTSPQLPECQKATPLATRNDYAVHRLSATATMPAAGKMVVAATSDPSGVSDNAAATSLKPSGSWSTTGSTGGFSWSYPIVVPPAAAGSDVTPAVALSYSSADVDGHVAGTNAQSSWVGVGWDYAPGFIERTYRTCADDTSAGSKKTQDLCWGGQVVTMSLNGASTPLVLDDAATNNGDGQTVRHWHAAHDNMQRVELVGAGPDGYVGEYWRITTTDGVRYYFGKNTLPGAADSTNSTLKVPVYAPHTGDPCSTAGSCTQAYRWNLDYVVDPNNNATAYYYTKETGYYGANNANTSVAYDRASFLSRIDYGLHWEDDGTATGSAYTHGTPQQIAFTVASRCFTGDCTVKTDGTVAAPNQVNWQDTPVDLLCARTTCAQHSPSFFSLRYLTTITTSVKTGSTRQTVDTYALRSKIEAGATQLWLKGITRTASGGTGGNIPVPEVTFGYTDMANRVAGYGTWPAMPFGRLTRIDAETGAITTVSYTNSPSGGPLTGGATAPCDSSTFPAPNSVTAAQLQANTHLCYPVYWTPPYETDPQIGLAWKYVVKKVTVADPRALTPAQVTTYGYDGDPAWHLDETELTKPKHRTYSQFRGYQTVETTTGDTNTTSNGVADRQTLSTTTYFRGMGGSAVTNSRSEAVTDDNALAGTVFETRTFNGLTAGDEISTTITDPVVPVVQTGKRDRTSTGLTALLATRVDTARSRVLTDKLSTATAGDVTTKTSTYTSDSLGRTIKVQDSGTSAPLCTFTTYADNVATWIRSKAARVRQSAQACPVGANPTTTVLSDVSTLYDKSPTTGAIPTAGNATEVDTAVSAGDTARVSVEYDTSGRVQKSTASDGSAVGAAARTTSNIYTPDVGGPLTSTKTTNALEQSTTIILSIDRNLPLTSTDVAGNVTTTSYDALGRPLSTWSPGRPTTTTADVVNAYTLNNTQPLAVSTKRLVDTGTVYSGDGEHQVTSVTLADALGQVVQTQTDAEDGTILVADTTYDSHGWTVATGKWGTKSSTSLAVISPGATDAVHDRTQTTYDQAGRPVTTAAYDGTTAVAGMSTTLVYGGDRTTTLPPTGGVASLVVTDVNGKTLTNQRFTRPPTVAGSVVSGGAPDTTTYTYDALGRLATMTDADYTAAAWSWSYDQLGRTVSANDPDTGTTATTYDDFGDTATVTDANNSTLAYDYDKLGRKTNERLGSNTGAIQATWTYDTLQAGKLTASTRYTDGNAYTVAATGYNALGEVTGTKITLPTSTATGGLAASYSTTSTYSSTGLLLTLIPVAAGGLPAETLTYGYTYQGRPKSLVGNAPYTTASSYDVFGEVTGQTRSATNDSVDIVNSWDLQSHRLTNVGISARTVPPQLDNTAIAYDPAGNVTSITDRQGSSNGPVEKQCFSYDGLDRLTQAYTNAGLACARTATAAQVGGAQPYWQSWSFDSTGGQAKSTHYSTTGGTDEVMTFTNGVATSTSTHAHALATTVTSGGTTPGSDNYTYDATGQTLTGVSGAGVLTNTWTPQHRVKSTTVGTDSRSAIYDADNNLLLETTPDKKTAYLAGVELALDTTTSPSRGTITGTRFYSFAGAAIAVRVSTTAPYFLFGNDQHGTAQIAYEPHTQKLSRRQYDPYGNPIGAVLGAQWPDSHTFLGAPTNALTALTHLGAREYNSLSNRFESVDPLLSASNPEQNNGYGYADFNPVRSSDPTGLKIEGQYTGGVAGFNYGRVPSGTSISGRPAQWSRYTLGVNSGGSRGNRPALSPTVVAGTQPRPGVDYSKAIGPDPVVSFIEALNPWTDIHACYSDPSFGSCIAAAVQVGIAAGAIACVVFTDGGCSLVEILGGTGAYAAGATVSTAAGGGALVSLTEIEEGMAGASGTAAVSRGISNFAGVFSAESNAAGGTVVTASGGIAQDDFASMVNSGLMKGDVNILTGQHGFADGTRLVDRSLYEDDLARFGNLPGVHVYNMPDLSSSEISSLVRGPGTTIGAFCDSGACLAPYK